jgi:hypothetical protein
LDPVVLGSLRSGLKPGSFFSAEKRVPKSLLSFFQPAGAQEVFAKIPAEGGVEGVDTRG